MSYAIEMLAGLDVSSRDFRADAISRVCLCVLKEINTHLDLLSVLHTTNRSGLSHTGSYSSALYCTVLYCTSYQVVCGMICWTGMELKRYTLCTVD